MRFRPFAMGLATIAIATAGMAADSAGEAVDMDSPYQAFQVLESVPVNVPGGTIAVVFAPGPMSLTRETMLDWMEDSAAVVARYFGRFPVSEAKLLVVPTDGDRVRFGNAFGHQGAAVRIFVGADADGDALRRDWILVHELIHLAVPDVARSHHWLEEGVAVYVESIARLQAGDLSEAFVWKGFVDGMPNGLPRSGDQGLDRTPTWGRTYWGGALFCLVADVRIREQTANRLGLQDALRAVVDAGGSIEERWPVARIFEVGDRATGTSVLTDLYQAWRTTPVDVDLDRLWADLGVQVNDGRVEFDDAAPLAAVRRGLASPPSAGG